MCFGLCLFGGREELTGWVSVFRIQLWDVYNEGKCLRTFMGHSKAVHDVTFDNDGGQFLSAAFDRQMKLWDTETGQSLPSSRLRAERTKADVSHGTGQCKQAFSNGKIPYCIKFNPNDNNVFLAGMSDKKVIQVRRRRVSLLSLSRRALILTERRLVQYDMRSGDIVQDYDQHLGPVRCLPFLSSSLPRSRTRANIVRFFVLGQHHHFC